MRGKDIELMKAKLNESEGNLYRGTIVRARAERFLFGEQPSKRALADDKKYASSKGIISIQCGPMVTSNRQALKHVFIRR